ncbi:4-hydroxyphenylpyruvate dioxygenase-like protein [Rhizophagus clarus]|nr:4-hydroxyphenylpyruvate dioxygenase-like protein [Rhizophagus clarus]
MNNSSPLLQQSEASEPLLLCSSNNNSSSSLRQYATAAHDNKEEMKRWSWAWWKEWTIIIAVFGITGSTTVRIVRPIVTNVFGVEGSFLEGPWSYRLTYLSITLPLYSIILLGVGTIFRRYNYFKKIVFRMWGRFIPSRLINNISNNGKNSSGGVGVV